MTTLEFRSEDPFPLAVQSPYEEQKAHAVQVDAWLGLAVEAVEDVLKAKNLAADKSVGDSDDEREFWIGKSVQTFSTPYTELRAILEDLTPQPGQTLFDLGAGYGRIAHVMARHFPETRLVGFELVRERQLEAQRVIEARGLPLAKVVCEDAARINFDEHSADFYFIYDFGGRRDVELCVENLKKLASEKPVTVVARGGRSRDIIEKSHAWLSQVVAPLHRDRYSIYRSRES